MVVSQPLTKEHYNQSFNKFCYILISFFLHENTKVNNTTIQQYSTKVVSLYMRKQQYTMVEFHHNTLVDKTSTIQTSKIHLKVSHPCAIHETNGGRILRGIPC